MKKSTLSCAFLTTLGVSSVVCAQPFDGFYVNLGVGGTAAEYQMEQFSEFGVAIDDIAFESLSGGSKADVYGNSWVGIIGAGYRYCIADGWILGLEVTADVESAKGSDEFFANQFVGVDLDFFDERFELDAAADQLVAGKTTTKLENNFSVLFKPMYLVGPRTALYALVGPKWGQFKTTTSAESFAGIEIDEEVFAAEGLELSDKASGYTVGITAGLGIEHYVADQFSIALEWDYTDYGKIKHPDNELFVVGEHDHHHDDHDHHLESGLANDTKKVKAQTNTIFFKVAYTFS